MGKKERERQEGQNDDVAHWVTVGPVTLALAVKIAVANKIQPHTLWHAHEYKYFPLSLSLFLFFLIN